MRRGQDVSHTIVMTDGVATVSRGAICGKGSQRILSAVVRLIRYANTLLHLLRTEHSASDEV